MSHGVGYRKIEVMDLILIFRIDVKTSSRIEFRDITGEVRDAVGRSGVKNGVCFVFVPHTTAGILINEHADPAVAEDIADQLESIVPREKHYRHLEGNAPAHIKASLIGDSRTLFIEDGKLLLGTWQGIFFGEFDGPRTRNVMVKVMADRFSP
jgi:secondary thiamine-phosphate synthase enzyme